MLENEPTGGAPRAAENEQNDQAINANAPDENANPPDEGASPQQPEGDAAPRPSRRRRGAARRPAGPPAAGDEPEAVPVTAAETGNESGDRQSRSVPAVVFQPPAPAAEVPDPDEPSHAGGTSRGEGASTSGEAVADEDGPDGVERALTGSESDSTDTGEDEAAEGPAERPSRRRRRRGGRNRGRGRQAAGESGDEASTQPSETGDTVPDASQEGTADDVGTVRPGDRADTSGQAASPGEAVPSGGEAEDNQAAGQEARDESSGHDAGGEDSGQGSGSTRRRRRRRRRGGSDSATESPDDPPNTVVKVREPRRTEDEVQSIKGSTRLEAKKQRRREGRDPGRRRAPVISESEFLARRESVERVLVVRQRGDTTEIAVLEDGILVEHYVDRSSHTSYVGNVYLGKVQNVLPSMEAAFVDVGKGRNGVLYAGEVNYDVTGLEGQPKRIEQALKSGQNVLVQVTKDPQGHKGARLTSQVSLPGRYLVYVPEGSMTGISRKLPERERSRLKSILRKVVPDEAGVIVRTAAEGASEEELSRDIARLTAQWEDILRKAKSSSAPARLYGEPDLTIRVVRDIFNEDFTRLVVSGDDAWDTVDSYVRHVAPHLVERLRQWTDDEDAFAAYRVDEQISKALDRKVWLPSGGSLIIDRTEAMVVVDVNTGRFTGQGGNLEETVTKNNLEAAEELVRQLRLRDLGGIIVIDFIDMVLESNRELVLRRLLECLARDRTKHQVAEVTSLGLVQMTRKRVGQGLLEAFSQTCDCCNGRGVIVSPDALAPASSVLGSGPERGGQDAPASQVGEATAGDGGRAGEANGATEPRAGQRRGSHGGNRGRSRRKGNAAPGEGKNAMESAASTAAYGNGA